jgi:YVTN family beta-propeller protein
MRTLIAAVLVGIIFLIETLPACAEPFAYVTNSTSNDVSVIDTATNTVASTVTVGSVPIAVAIAPNGNLAYVTNFGSSNVSVIDTATNTVVTTVPVGAGPQGLAVTPNGANIYIANSGSDSVSVFDTVTNTVSTTISVGAFPRNVTISPDGTYAYITNHLSDNVSVINTATDTVSSVVTVGSRPLDVAITPDGAYAYVTNLGFISGATSFSSVSVIDTALNTVTTTLTPGDFPRGVAITPDGSYVYVVVGGDPDDPTSANVSVINTATNTVSTAVTVGLVPIAVAIRPDGAVAYVTNSGSDNVSLIDTATNTVTVTVSVGSSPTGIAISTDAPGSSVPAVTCAAPGGCNPTGGQTIELPPGLVIPPGATITQTVLTQTDPRVAAGTCGLEPLVVPVPGKPDLILPEYLCGSPEFAILDTESDLQILDGTVTTTNQPGAFFADPLTCDSGTALGITGDPQLQDVAVWQPTEPADVPEGYALEVTFACGSSRGKTKGLSYFVVGLHIDFGLSWADDPWAVRAAFVDLTKGKLYGMLNAIRVAKRSLPRRQFARIALIGGIANLAFHFRLYDLASAKLGLLIQEVEAADFDASAVGNPRGNILMRAYNAKFMTDEKVIAIRR